MRVNWKRRLEASFINIGRFLRHEPRFIYYAFILSFKPWVTLGLSVLLTVLLWPRELTAATIPVRFVEGVTRAFLVVRTVTGAHITQGDLFQIVRGGEVESRMVIPFKDGSVFDETVVFTQRGFFALQKYHLIQRGPVFTEDTKISLERALGKYRVETKNHKDGQGHALDGTLHLLPDVYNGMVLTVAKNLPKGTSETIHLLAFTPTPRLIQLKLEPAGEHKVLVGELEKNAVHFVLKPKLGIWLGLFARLLGRVPPDYHAWIILGEPPAFARFAGPLTPTGPVWLIELAVPRWPD